VEVFKKDLKVLLEDIIPVWFFDETGFRVGAKPRKVLAFKGDKPVILIMETI